MSPAVCQALFQWLGCSRHRTGHSPGPAGFILWTAFPWVMEKHRERLERVLTGMAICGGPLPPSGKLPETTQPASQGWGWTCHRDALGAQGLA